MDSSTLWITRVSHKIGLNTTKKMDLIIKFMSGKAAQELDFHGTDILVFPIIGVPQNGWFIMENPIKMADLGRKKHYFQKHPYTYRSMQSLIFVAVRPMGPGGG